MYKHLEMMILLSSYYGWKIKALNLSVQHHTTSKIWGWGLGQACLHTHLCASQMALEIFSALI